MPLRTLQLRRDGEAVRLVYNTREGPALVTPFAAPNDIATYDLKCGTCGRHLKRHEDWLIQTAFALAGHQGGIRRASCGHRVYLTVARVYRLPGPGAAA